MTTPPYSLDVGADTPLFSHTKRLWKMPSNSRFYGAYVQAWEGLSSPRRWQGVWKVFGRKFFTGPCDTVEAAWATLTAEVRDFVNTEPLGMPLVTAKAAVADAEQELYRQTETYKYLRSI